MPNWCDNSVILSHKDKSKIDALEEEMNKKNSEGNSLAEPFNHLRPNPAGEWNYDWSLQNWGTKWDANVVDWLRDEDSIYLFFCSAWTPPITLYDYLVEQGWEINALYNEPGMGYGGKYTTDDGDDYYEYDIDNLESIEELPEDIIEFGDLRGEYESRKEQDEEEMD